MRGQSHEEAGGEVGSGGANIRADSEEEYAKENHYKTMYSKQFNSIKN